MLENLLIHIVQEGGKNVPYFGGEDGAGWIGEALLYALIGFVVTFIGIIVLICIVWICGKIVNCFSALGKKRREVGAAEPAALPAAEADGIGEETRVAIMAAIAAYYASENSACEFQVKRIKRL